MNGIEQTPVVTFTHQQALSHVCVVLYAMYHMLRLHAQKLHGQLLLLLLSIIADMLCTAPVRHSMHTPYRKPFRSACT